MTNQQLLAKAKSAMQNAYAPYSGFLVGAALLCADGTIYTGCNIENASFSVTNCAERTALFKAISDGKRQFCAIAVVGGHGGVCSDFATPCGVCRQAFSEFCDNDLRIILGTDDGRIKEYTLGALLPDTFALK